jgi:hypothetical protein
VKSAAVPWSMPLLSFSKGRTKPAFLFDGRNITDLAALRKIGFRAFGIGKA